MPTDALIDLLGIEQSDPLNIESGQGYRFPAEAKPQPESNQPPPYSGSDELGVGEELRGIGWSLNRGARRFVQSGDIAGIRKSISLEDQLKREEESLAKFDEDFPNTTAETNPRGWQWRQDQLGKISGLRGELQRYKTITPKLAESFSKQESEIGKLPLTKAQAEFQKPETPWYDIFKNPVELAATGVAESAPQMALTMAAGAATGPAAAVITAGGTSHVTESAGRVINSMMQDGVDTKDPQQVLAWFKDRSKSDPATAKADLAALGPATFDALTAGIDVGWRWLGEAIGKGVKPVAVATGKEIGVQMAGGGAGSVAGSLLVGEKPDWKDVAMSIMARQSAINPWQRFTESLSAGNYPGSSGYWGFPAASRYPYSQQGPNEYGLYPGDAAKANLARLAGVQAPAGLAGFSRNGGSRYAQSDADYARQLDDIVKRAYGGLDKAIADGKYDPTGAKADANAKVLAQLVSSAAAKSGVDPGIFFDKKTNRFTSTTPSLYGPEFWNNPPVAYRGGSDTGTSGYQFPSAVLNAPQAGGIDWSPVQEAVSNAPVNAPAAARKSTRAEAADAVKRFGSAQAAATWLKDSGYDISGYAD